MLIAVHFFVLVALFRYCNGHKVKMGFGEHWDYTGASHLRELHILLKKYLLIRREKAEVLKQLPAKRRQTVTLDVPATRLAKLKKLQVRKRICRSLRRRVEVICDGIAR